MGARAKQWPAVKDPNEVKDYLVDWSDLITGDETISTSTWLITGGNEDGDASPLALDSNSKAAATTTVWLSGGTAGRTYRLRNRVTTNASRTYDQTVKLDCRDK